MRDQPLSQSPQTAHGGRSAWIAPPRVVLGNVDTAASQATRILDKQHRIRDAATRDYDIKTFTGLIGVGLGLAITQAGIVLLSTLGAGVPGRAVPIQVMSSAPALIAFGVSVAIDVLAGGYPAHRAAGLRPIKVLRFE